MLAARREAERQRRRPAPPACHEEGSWPSAFLPWRVTNRRPRSPGSSASARAMKTVLDPGRAVDQRTRRLRSGGTTSRMAAVVIAEPLGSSRRNLLGWKKRWRSADRADGTICLNRRSVSRRDETPRLHSWPVASTRSAKGVRPKRCSPRSRAGRPSRDRAGDPPAVMRALSAPWDRPAIRCRREHRGPPNIPPWHSRP